jgi:hypothetical protein
MNTTTKIILGILALGTVGVGGYFLYKKFGTTSATADVQDAEYEEMQQAVASGSGVVPDGEAVAVKQETPPPPILGKIGESKTILTKAESEAKQKQFQAKGKLDIFGDLKSNYKSN